MKVCILYGWGEGPLQGKLLRAELRRAGFTTIKHPAEADILITHSGGCYLLPVATKARLVVMVGVPYWPGKHPLRALPEKVRGEAKSLWWYKKTVLNSYYMLTRPRRLLKMWRRWLRQPWPDLPNPAVIVVRNENDAFMQPLDKFASIMNKDWKLIELPGQHDDIWLNPKPYVQIIKQHSK